MVTVESVTKQYVTKATAFTALDDVSFEIPDGTTAAIIGKSGSGKSTLMHVMSGLDHPTSGRIVIDGKDLRQMKAREVDAFRARSMSFIFQAFFVEANQTCYQNVMLPLEIAGVAVRERRAKVERALAAVGLADRSGQKASTLSGGQKQRLAIARAIVNNPQLIFADEPTGNLDSTTGEQIIRLLIGLNQRLGCTVVIVTHDPELAARCQLQIRMKDGRVQAITPVAPHGRPHAPNRRLG